MFEDIISKFSLASLPLTAEQAEKMDKMILFLQDYCNKVNLTAIRERADIIEKHLIDSVLPLKLYTVPEKSRCLDIGTGAGFPAIPMMICRPDMRFTLLDAQRKRTDYLKLLSEKLSVRPEEIIHGRAEELGRNAKYKNRYDMITARAVSDLSTLLSYAAPMLKSKGVFLAMRGSKEEIDENVKKMCGKFKIELIENISYNLPSGDSRHLIVFEKS